MTTAYVHGRVEQDGVITPVAVDLNFHPDDPLKIYLGAAGASWVISRDLFIDGLNSHAGVGDVQIWPAGDGLNIRLRGNDTGDWDAPAYTAVLQVPYKPVQEFIAGTVRAVPPGTEQIDVDGLLVSLLGGDRS